MNDDTGARVVLYDSKGRPIASVPTTKSVAQLRLEAAVDNPKLHDELFSEDYSHMEEKPRWARN